jgi:transcriptional regulator with XRE-family HTH domain
MASQPTSRIAATIGANIRFARESKGLRQRDLARQLDTEAFMVSRWERGAHKPSDERMYELADALGRDVEWFFADNQPEREAA